MWSSSNVLSTWDTPLLRAQSRQPVLLTLNGVFTMNAETASGVIRIGNKANGPAFNADGIIDEFKIYSAPLAEIAQGGLTSDAREYLASSSNNFPVVTSGQYWKSRMSVLIARSTGVVE